jgi:hypothetical protein
MEMIDYRKKIIATLGIDYLLDPSKLVVAGLGSLCGDISGD